MGQGFGVGEIVNGNKFDVFVIERSAKHVSPDASESVDSYFNCHVASRNLVKTREPIRPVMERKW